LKDSWGSFGKIPPKMDALPSFLFFSSASSSCLMAPLFFPFLSFTLILSFTHILSCHLPIANCVLSKNKTLRPNRFGYIMFWSFWRRSVQLLFGPVLRFLFRFFFVLFFFLSSFFSCSSRFVFSFSFSGISLI